MLQETQGIVLHHIKYGESSIIATVYTQQFGRQSVIVQSVRKKRASTKRNLFQALSILDMQIYRKPGRELQRVKEAQPAYIFDSLPYDLEKQSIAMFLGEFLYKTIKEETPEPALFQFLTHSIQALDLMKEDIANFHILFLLKLTQYLGIAPDPHITSESFYFQPEQGGFIAAPPHSMNTHKTYSRLLRQFLLADFKNIPKIKLSRTERQYLIDYIVSYYQYHMNINYQLNAYKILQQVYQ